jgi:SAM-dependent methyltransferase
MTDVGRAERAPVGPDATTQAIFQQQWQIYRSVVDHNYLFHREVYDCLRRILVNEAPQPFRFLDVGCGDATDIADVLSGTRIARYHGTDLSAAALELAGRSLAVLDCPVTLEQRDFVDALARPAEQTDVVWIGLSLHHLQNPAKLTVMRTIRGIVGDQGQLLVYEPTSPDGEDRPAWLRRWDLQQPSWTAYPPAAWEALTAHVHAADFPETVSRWHALGRAAGFSSVREVFTAPTDLFRLYRFADPGKRASG